MFIKWTKNGIVFFFVKATIFFNENNSDEFLFLNWEFIFLSYVSDVLIISSLLLSQFI